MKNNLVGNTREDKKRAMIASFMQVFSKNGLDGSFVRRLAKEAGVNEALLYRFFENKDDLIRQSTIVYHTRIENELANVVLEHINQPEDLAQALLEYIDSVIDECRFLLQVMAHPKYCVFMEETEPGVQAAIKKIAVDLQEGFTLSAEQAHALGLLLNSIINDYVLKKNKENYFIQFAGIRHILSHTQIKK